VREENVWGGTTSREFGADGRWTEPHSREVSGIGSGGSVTLKRGVAPRPLIPYPDRAARPGPAALELARARWAAYGAQVYAA